MSAHADDGLRRDRARPDSPDSIDSRVDFERLRAALAARPATGLRIPGFREAAVLVPILDEPETPERLILTLRQAALRSHAGQIAFPGGQRDPADPTPAATALRETVEELGVPAARIDVLGVLDDLPTPTGYNITPVVARVAGPVALSPSVAEVAEAFLVPLAGLSDAHHHGGVRTFHGLPFEMHEYHVERRRIWGATARIIRQLLAILDRTRR